MDFVKCGVSWCREGNKGRLERVLGDLQEGPRCGQGGEAIGADAQGVHNRDHRRLWVADHSRGVFRGNIPDVYQKV